MGREGAVNAKGRVSSSKGPATTRTNYFLGIRGKGYTYHTHAYKSTTHINTNSNMHPSFTFLQVHKGSVGRT